MTSPPFLILLDSSPNTHKTPKKSSLNGLAPQGVALED